MQEKLTGIVFGGVNYGENDKILNIFTLEKGTVSAKIKGVKKAGAKLKFASEPFCFAEFIFSTSQNKRTVIGASLIDSFFAIRQDLVKYYCGATVLEFIKHFAKEGIANGQTFMLVIEALKNISYAKESPKSSVAYFLIKALEQVGYGLTITKNCAICKSLITAKPYFDYRTGCFYCQNCNAERVREINYSTFTAINSISENQMVNGEQATSVLRLIDFYLTNKTEEKLNSLKELLKF